ncbi:hypothetical protein AB0L65_17395 [Nonomuraea sp. NPDC052116]|uniref:hypothetical protein n=1 Tax=Nonomuraea sp. NPDC052116 TaxID=3155665 RepID=UPI003417EB30
MDAPGVPSGRARRAHSAAGPIDLHWETLLSPAEDQRLIILTPAPGTSAIDRLSLLRVLGHDDFVPAADSVRGAVYPASSWWSAQT